MKDFFISYTGADTDYATWIAQILEEEGKTVTIQAWDFLPGENFVAQINKALKECNKIIVVLSKAYLESKWCEEEWTSKLAQKNSLSERRIIPIKIEKVEIIGLLAPIVHIDVVGKNEEEAKKLILDGVSGIKARVSNGFPQGNQPQTAVQSTKKAKVGVNRSPGKISEYNKLHEFKKKLSVLSDKDGMLNNLYESINHLSTDDQQQASEQAIENSTVRANQKSNDISELNKLRKFKEKLSVLADKNGMMNSLYESFNQLFPDDQQQTSEQPIIDSTAREINKLDKFHEFIKKLSDLADKDGMMSSLYESFNRLSTDDLELNDIVLLSIIQDEYQKILDQSLAGKKRIRVSGFERIMSDPNVVDLLNNPQTHPLVVTYLNFVKADKMYYVKKYDEAISYYQSTLEKIESEYKDKEISEDDECRCVYLMNSIAWSYRLRNNAGDIQKAIDIYKQLFQKYENADNFPTSSTYRRNYGVCLELAGCYDEALVQYQKGLRDHPSIVQKSILYITYCSVIMKSWDQKTGKLSGDWIKGVRKAYREKPSSLNDKTFQTIATRLGFAHQHAPERLLPDVYIQQAKMLTYKYILAQTAAEKNHYNEEIQQNLIILEDLSGDAPGWHYVKRDFNYVLYELTRIADKKERYYQTAWDENELLKGMGRKRDTEEFGNMLLQKVRH